MMFWKILLFHGNTTRYYFVSETKSPHEDFSNKNSNLRLI